MKISVVTAALNAARTIGFALDSFVEQQHPDKELLVIDGGSNDGTVAIARSYSAHAVSVVSESDRGIYDAMNKGLRQYSGDAVGFLNADDRFADSRCLSCIADALQEADITYGHVDFFENGDVHRVLRRWRATPYRPGAFKSGWMPPHPTFYMRRRVVEAVGLFDLSFRVAADYDYMLRVFETHGFRAAFIDRVMVKMQYGGRSTRGVGAYLRGNLESHRSRMARLGVTPLHPSLLMKPARKILQFLLR